MPSVQLLIVVLGPFGVSVRGALAWHYISLKFNDIAVVLLVPLPGVILLYSVTKLESFCPKCLERRQTYLIGLDIASEFVHIGGASLPYTISK